MLLGQTVRYAQARTGLVPLTEVGRRSYLGAPGGLYPGQSNTPPPAHLDFGRAMSSRVEPRTSAGVVDGSGKIVLLSIGMSNLAAETSKLLAMVSTDPIRNRSLTVVNGALHGASCEEIDATDAPYWTHVAERLAGQNATPLQVQVVWLKAASRSNEPFPEGARRLHTSLRRIGRILETSFPNLALIYLSSRVFAGYSSTLLNPEPFAYQSGFAAKWLIEDQIRGDGPVGRACWLGWGPYLWADGMTPRAGDGLSWTPSDFQEDGTHPSEQGAVKVARMMLDFLRADPTASAWYLRGGDGTPRTSPKGNLPRGAKHATRRGTSRGTIGSPPDVRRRADQRDGCGTARSPRQRRGRWNRQ